MSCPSHRHAAQTSELRELFGGARGLCDGIQVGRETRDNVTRLGAVGANAPWSTGTNAHYPTTKAATQATPPR